MIVKKENVTFKIINHTAISSPYDIKKQINIEISNETYYVTNAGILKNDQGFSWFCPKSFSQKQAEKYIKNLSEEIQT